MLDGGFYDEMFAEDGAPRPQAAALVSELARLGAERLMHAGRQRDAIFIQQGVTFDATGEDGWVRDRPFPLDLVPRILHAEEWSHIKRGLAQRVRALNSFIDAVVYADAAATAVRPAIARHALAMLARIAHELFWLGRNVTRAELTARMVDGVFQADVQARPAGPVSVTLSWTSLLAIMGVGIGGADGAGNTNLEPVGRDQTLAYLTLDERNRSSVMSCVARAREGARSARDAISAEMWEAINTFHLGFTERGGIESGPYELASYVKNRCALFWGLSARTMLRDEAYAFLEAGGRLESADMVLRMLRVALPPAGAEGEEGSPRRDGQALALLQAVGGLQAYSRALAAPPDATPVARFLLFTRSYPDSVAASVEAVRVALSAADAAPRASEPVLRLSRLSADLEFRGGASGDESELRQVCEIVSRELGLIDHDITERYFGGSTSVEQVVTG